MPGGRESRSSQWLAALYANLTEYSAARIMVARLANQPPKGCNSPSLGEHVQQWRSFLNFVELPKVRIFLLIATAILAAMSEFFSIALIQPIIILFAGQEEQAANLFWFQLGVVDWLQGMSATNRVIALVGLLIFLQALRECLLFISEFTSIRIRTAFEVSLRMLAYERALFMPMLEYTKTTSGDIYIILNALPRSVAGYVFGVLSMIPNAFMLAVYTVLMIVLDWRLTLVVGLISLVTFSAMRIVYRNQHRFGRIMRDTLIEVASKSNELIQALPVIRSFTQEPRLTRAYREVVGRHMAASVASSTINSAIGPLQRVLSFVVILVAILIFFLASGTSEKQFLIVLIVFMVIISRINAPLSSMNVQRSGLAQLYPSVERLNEFLRSHPGENTAGGLPVTNFERITFEEVSYSYDGATQVLKGVNFSIEKGEFVALVGPSGAGKSTLVLLINAFAEPTSGRILVDGLDLRDLDKTQWRRCTSVVPQSPYMFDLTVFENLRFGRPDASKEEVMEAARLSNVEELIPLLPNGYDAPTGEGGSLLSGGQVQRLALARALLTHPDLLILDEATSAQDTGSEEKIRMTLGNLRGRVALFVIAHRLSTVKAADKIVVLDQGKIVEIGPHDDLMRHRGLYYNLVQRSFGDVTGGLQETLQGSKVAVPSGDDEVPITPFAVTNPTV